MGKQEQLEKDADWGIDVDPADAAGLHQYKSESYYFGGKGCMGSSASILSGIYIAQPRTAVGGRGDYK